jgi:hypothetical protein
LIISITFPRRRGAQSPAKWHSKTLTVAIHAVGTDDFSIAISDHERCIFLFGPHQFISVPGSELLTRGN